MKNFTNFFFLILLAWLLPSCVVTNNLYVNDPTPLGKNNGFGYIGAGTGIKLKMDSISNNTTINFSDKISAAPVLSLGGQIGVGERMNLKGAIHFPQIIGGFGIRGGAQYSFFNPDSRFNAALGVDLGGVWGRDSIKFLEMKLPHEVNNAFNADFSLPISFKFKEHFSMILTPRYSFNSFDVKRFTDRTISREFTLFVPVLSLGARIQNFYLEASTIYYNNTLYPHFGVAFIIPRGGTEKNKK